jgi:hypothetical protein
MPLTDRDYMKGKHPPSCTCVDCVNERLGIKTHSIRSYSQKQNNELLQEDVYKHIEKGTSPAIEKKQEKITNDGHNGNIHGGNTARKRANSPIPKWLIALLFVFTFTILGLGLSLFVGNPIPLWLLLGFSFIYSIGKWFSIITLKHKGAGKLYRLLLNVSILAVLGLIIWSGIQLFTHHFFKTPTIGSFIFIAELILFIWMWSVVAKNGWRWPSLKLTMFTLIILFFVFAFAGVRPINSYKDDAFSHIKSFFSNLSQTATDTQKTTAPLNPTSLAFPTTTTKITPNVIATTTTSKIKTIGIDEKTGKYKNYYLGLVNTPDGVSGGEDCYGEFIVLINNENASNPTYNKLLSFLKSDKTDEFPYQNTFSSIGFYYGEAEDRIDLEYVKSIIDGTKQPGSPKICADFAERLHNNAEMAGIRCGYVIIDNLNHALNAFETTDRGIVYIDDTGVSLFGPSNCDKVVTVKEGIEYIPRSIFPEEGWSDTWDSLGTIGDIFVTWDGDWR